MREHHGCIIGWTTREHDLAAPVTLTREDRRRHVHVIGRTGTGKTTLLKRLIVDELESGGHFALLDPLGHLAQACVDAVPRERNDEVVYFDPSDLAHPIGFNPLDRVPRDMRHRAADHCMQAFLKIWGGSLEGTPRLVYVLYNALRLLLDNDGSTLLGVQRLLVDDRYRERLLKNCTDDVVAGYFCNEFAAYTDRFKAEVISPIQNKVGMLLADPALRAIIGQPRSTLDIARLMNGDVRNGLKPGCLIADLSKGRISETTTHLLGALLATKIAQVAEERASIPWEDRIDFSLYADEVQNITTDSFAHTLSESRNWKLSLVLAHQYLAQLPERVQNAIFGNCSNSIVFRVGALDAPKLAPELDISNHSTLMETSNFKAWVRLLINGSPSNAFLIDTAQAEPPETGRTAAVIAHTHARHTRPRSMVERMIARQINE